MSKMSKKISEKELQKIGRSIYRALERCPELLAIAEKKGLIDHKE
jgi:hypothetical protein